MKKSKKILLGLSPIAAILPAVAVSCGNNDESNISFKEKDISKYTTTNANGKQVVKNAELLKLKPVLITDEGKIDDKSFNQSAFEALKAINKQTGIEINNVEPSSNFESAYNSHFQPDTKFEYLMASNTNNLLNNTLMLTEKNLKEIKSKSLVSTLILKQSTSDSTHYNSILKNLHLQQAMQLQVD
ncbi:variable surface lipoprotein [Mycoplasmopsis fermentans]|uniref:variable surface lipoprotein n=1 Tax=Mycoplasmopsis fermentans TaxID=2115 RepID=UPI000FF336E1|nr:variable surface lipoprotein [Mycoplasmopsis fermentans]RMX34596.1 basic membrane family protein [Mycoplasmopsis fermentans MF-I1]